MFADVTRVKVSVLDEGEGGGGRQGEMSKVFVELV